MIRKVEFDIEGAKAIAMMHEGLTPKACDAIWNKLPLEGMSIMAKWSYREIMLHLPGDMYIELEQEGPRSLYTAPGDICYFLRGPGRLGVQKEYAPEFQRRLCEFAIYYGSRTNSIDDPGRMMDQDKMEVHLKTPRVNVFWAHMERPIPRDFFLKCESIRHGRKKLIIRRYEK